MFLDGGESRVIDLAGQILANGFKSADDRQVFAVEMPGLIVPA